MELVLVKDVLLVEKVVMVEIQLLLLKVVIMEEKLIGDMVKLVKNQEVLQDIMVMP